MQIYKKAIGSISVFFLLFIFITGAIAKSKFEDLDKDPIGAHKGQILLGAFFSMGGILGDTVTQENLFIANTVYTFSSSGTSKLVWLADIGFSAGLIFEYMPIDHLGIRTKFKGTLNIQRTLFGANYQNWSQVNYRDFSLYAGLAAHVTNRKQWDITFNVLAGYAAAGLTPATVAYALNKTAYSTEVYAGGYTMCGEVNFTAYFSGGLFFSIGFDWTMNMISVAAPFTFTNSQTGAVFASEKKDFINHTLSFIFSAGYAFSN
jgi:hypothetical protein